jgi:hypothetical protein
VELVQGGRVNATDGIPASAQEQAPAVLRVRLLEGRARVLQAGLAVALVGGGAGNGGGEGVNARAPWRPGGA